MHLTGLFYLGLGSLEVISPMLERHPSRMYMIRAHPSYPARLFQTMQLNAVLGRGSSGQDLDCRS